MTATDSPIAPDDPRLQRFDAAAQAKREADEREIERQRQLVVDLLETEAASAEQRREGRRLAEEHAAKRPARWAALPRLVQALYVTAAERPFTHTHALIRVAQLLTAADHNFQTPPNTFERESGQ
jgi:hypothetical protein